MEITSDRVISEATGSKKTGFWQTLFIISIVVAITISESIFAYFNVAYGIVISLALVIIIYLMISLVKFDRSTINASESLVLIPLYILFTASLPWFFINQQYLLPAVYSCILALCLWHVYQKRLSLKEIFGLHREHWLKKDVLTGLMLGIPLGTAEYLILRPAPAFPDFQVVYLLRDAVYMIGFVGIGEELLFRGLIQRDLINAFGVNWGITVASFLFAVMHLTWRSVPELGFVFLAALILGRLYQRTNCLMAPIIAHGVNNIMLVAVLPYLLHLS
ncbi:MAG TPA: type II CAAX endopeptidase family protein [Dehalococcoidales bacterium]|nr:type II CAAX endopeptidase family protein [Dehalococcoidales bacterium]